MSFISKNLSLNGWKKYFSCFLLGCMATLALPPFFLFPFLIVAFTFFYLLLEKAQNKKQAFWTGWWFGFGHFVSGLYWISNSLLVEPEKFAWMIPFAVSLIPAVLAIYIGFVALLTHKIPSKIKSWRRIILFACLWVLAEMLRAVLFTGFPWNLTGYSWNFSTSILQLASVFGIYGLSLLAVITATIPAVLISGGMQEKRNSKPVLVIVLILVGIFATGTIRQNMAVPPSKEIKIRIVQPNIPQTLKWSAEHERLSFEKLLKLTEKEDENGFVPELIIWPEAAVPFFLEEEKETRNIIASKIPTGSYLLLGALRTTQLRGYHQIFNSVLLMNSKGDIVASYDKHHLVPFGEFVPLRNIFTFINKITPGNVDFSRGRGAQTINYSPVPPFSPLICYEDIFPGEVIDKNDLPAFLINVTNDGWFGNSTGPYQHFEMARVRAVEEGITVLRIANTGISGIVNNLGNILNKTTLNTDAVLDAKITWDLSQKFLTIYARYGNLTIFILMLFLFLLSTRNIRK